MHIVVSISGVLARPDRVLKTDHCKWMTREDGSTFTPTELRTELCKLLARGFEVVPGAGCDDYDETGRCKGHAIAENEVP